jgi:hypothetical protein
MHQSKLAAKPPHHLTLKEKSQSKEYDLCKCGGYKTKSSPRCQDCFGARPKVSNKVFYMNGHACRYIPLTKGKVAIVWKERYEKLSQYKWITTRRSDGKGYYAIRFQLGAEGRPHIIKMHAEIACRGADHKNHNGLDNRDDNLRPCTPRQNAQNRLVRKNSQSGLKGAFTLKDPLKNGKTHRSYIQVNGKKIYLGFFYSAEEAARAYDRAAIRYFGEFAHTNFPRGDYADHS